MKKLILILVLLIPFIPSQAQTDFELEIVPFEIENLPSMHAYAFAQHDGKWLIIGGLTGEEPYSSYLNYDLLLIDPVKEKFWTYPAKFAELNIEEPEHLAACFSASQQVGNYLYIVGGMGHMAEADALGTYPYLTRVHVPKLIDAILEKDKIDHCFEQIEDENFRFMEATLSQIGSSFLLSNGRQLTGGFDEEGNVKIEQNPTSKNIVFTLAENSEKLELSSIKEIGDEESFIASHGSAVPQIFPDGEPGITVFHNMKIEAVNKLMWKNIFDFGYSTYTKAEAVLPHYHSTVIPVYDEESNRMHTLFLGGCDDYLCSDEPAYAPEYVEESIQFIRDENGNTRVVNNAIDTYLSKGKDALFLPTAGDVNGIIQLGNLKEDRNLIGYIYGGATAPSPMFFDSGEFLDTASNQLFKVYLTRKKDIDALGINFPNSEVPHYTIRIPN